VVDPGRLHGAVDRHEERKNQRRPRCRRRRIDRLANSQMSVTDTSRSLFVKVTGLDLRDARWTGGFWGERAEQCRARMVPTMGKLLTETERVRFLGNFEVACGVAEGKHRGPKWNDGDFYKWL